MKETRLYWGVMSWWAIDEYRPSTCNLTPIRHKMTEWYFLWLWRATSIICTLCWRIWGLLGLRAQSLLFLIKLTEISLPMMGNVKFLDHGEGSFGASSETWRVIKLLLLSIHLCMNDWTKSSSSDIKPVHLTSTTQDQVWQFNGNLIPSVKPNMYLAKKGIIQIVDFTKQSRPRARGRGNFSIQCSCCQPCGPHCSSVYWFC